MTKLLACAVIAASTLLASPRAFASDEWWVNASAKGTAGTRHYWGSDWYAKIGKGDLSVKPMFSEYSSDLSSGTYKTIAVRGAFDTKILGLGATVGGTPKTNGYSNAFFGVDGIVSLTPGVSGPTKRISSSDESSGPARGKGLARVDLGGAFKHTTHMDDLQAASVADDGRRGGRTAPRAKGLNIGQNDVTASAGVSVLEWLLSVDVTKSFYDRNLASVNARAEPVARLSGLTSTIQGFPNTNTAVRVEAGILPIVTPYATFVHTRYELTQPDSNAVTVGAYVELGIVEASASYEHFVQSGQPNENYGSLGATVRF